MYEWSRRTSLIGTDEYPYAHDYYKSSFRMAYVVFLATLMPAIFLVPAYFAIGLDVPDKSLVLWVCLPAFVIYLRLTFKFYINLVLNFLAPDPIISIRKGGIVFSCIGPRVIEWGEIVSVEKREFRSRSFDVYFITIETRETLQSYSGRLHQSTRAGLVRWFMPWCWPTTFHIYLCGAWASSHIVDAIEHYKEEYRDSRTVSGDSLVPSVLRKDEEAQ